MIEVLGLGCCGFTELRSKLHRAWIFRAPASSGLSSRVLVHRLYRDRTIELEERSYMSGIHSGMGTPSRSRFMRRMTHTSSISRVDNPCHPC